MGYQEQQVSFKFAGGVETKMDSKAVPATRLLALENGVFTRAISIKKRNGHERRSRTIAGRAVGLGGSASSCAVSSAAACRRSSSLRMDG